MEGYNSSLSDQRKSPGILKNKQTNPPIYIYLYPSLVVPHEGAGAMAAHVPHPKKCFQLLARAVIPALLLFLVERDWLSQKSVWYFYLLLLRWAQSWSGVSSPEWINADPGASDKLLFRSGLFGVTCGEQHLRSCCSYNTVQLPQQNQPTLCNWPHLRYFFSRPDSRRMIFFLMGRQLSC